MMQSFDLGNVARFLARSGGAGGAALFEGRICGCGEGAQPFAVHRDDYWAYAGHEPECCFAVVTERGKMNVLANRQTACGSPQFDGEIAQGIGQLDRGLGRHDVRLAPDGEADLAALGVSDINIIHPNDCHHSLRAAPKPTGTVTKAGRGSTAPGDGGAR